MAIIALGLNFSDRKLRLLACGVARTALEWKSVSGYRVAIDCGEALADNRRPPLPPEVARPSCIAASAVGGVTPGSRLALRCLEPVVRRRYSGIFPDHTNAFEAIEIATFRDLAPNPFVPLAWNPDWFTSAVRDLAAHIYAAHEFCSMPILADALQDAGCDDEQILTHCRADETHARGCWVLDAVLGKS
jgi:hypothetical protein